MLYPEYDELFATEDNGYDSPTILYRYFNADGVLLYVGVACDIERRDKQHSMATDWHMSAEFVRMEMFPNQRMAETAENHAIKEERPEYNWRSLNAHRPECARNNWYLYKMGGLRGELVRWATPSVTFGQRITQCDPPAWWDESRVFSLPYEGKPAKLKKRRAL